MDELYEFHDPSLHVHTYTVVCEHSGCTAGVIPPMSGILTVYHHLSVHVVGNVS